MRIARRGLLLSVLLGSVMSLPALAQDKVVIGYSAPGLVGAQAQIQAGLVNSAEAKGWEVLTATSGGDAQKQLNDINDFIAQGVSAIVAVPDDSVGICLAAQAKAAGIALVAQHAKFVPNLTIAENVFIGSLPLRAAGFVNWRAVFADAAERLGQFGLDLDVRRRMESTTVAERQMIEIARALFANATVVILDEPTAPLPKHDVAKLFGFVRAQRDRGPRSSISRIASKRFSMWPTG